MCLSGRPCEAVALTTKLLPTSLGLVEDRKSEGLEEQLGAMCMHHEVEVCKRCQRAMIRASRYDPDGVVPLHGGVKEYEGSTLEEWWVCIYPGCEDGRENVAGSHLREEGERV